MARILIVDDEPLNRKLLTAQLDGEGYELCTAASGDEALALAQETRPDLVILDVVMPGRDGYSTAAALKAAAGAEYLPIIFLTALTDQESRLRGLGVGADEFLTKPVEPHELLLRVSNLLLLKAKGTELSRRNAHLMELQRFRDEMSDMIVHDLKNPLSVLRLNVNFVADELRRQPTPYPELLSALDDAQAAGDRMTRLIVNLLAVSRLEDERMTLQRAPMEVSELVAPIVRERQGAARLRSIDLQVHVGEALQIRADRDLVTRVLENVLDNAIRHTPPAGRIEVSTLADEESAQIRIGNTGRAVPPEARFRIFDKFGQVTPDVGRMNLGLGLYFCRLVAEAHGGRIWVEETPMLPAQFVLSLPLA